MNTLYHPMNYNKSFSGLEVECLYEDRGWGENASQKEGWSHLVAKHKTIEFITVYKSHCSEISLHHILVNLPHLISLRLDFAEIGDNFGRQLSRRPPGGGLSQLTSLSIEESDCTDSGLLQVLTSLPCLSHLRLANSKICCPEGRPPCTATHNCLNLNTLDLTGSLALTEQGFWNIIKYINEDSLITLILSGTSLTDSGLGQVLTSLPHLSNLRLANSDIQCPEGPPPSGGMSATLHHHHRLNLLMLDLTESVGLTEQGFWNIVEYINVGSLQTLILAGCKQLVLQSPPKFATLRRLDISRCRRVTEDSVFAVLNSVDNIVTLNMSGLKHLTFCKLYLLTARLDCLQELNISNCENIGEMAFVYLLNHCGSHSPLKKLDMSYIDLCLSAVGELTSTLRLEELRMAGCTQITASRFATFINKIGESLEFLDASGLDLLMTDRIKVNQLPNLKALELIRFDRFHELGMINLVNRVGASLLKLNISYASVSPASVSVLEKASLQLLSELNISNCSLDEPTLLCLLDKASNLQHLILSTVEAHRRHQVKSAQQTIAGYIQHRTLRQLKFERCGRVSIKDGRIEASFAVSQYFEFY